MLQALTCGLSSRASEMLQEALDAVYGSGVVEVVDVPLDEVKVKSRMAISSSEVIVISLDRKSREQSSGSVLESPKFLEYQGDSSFAQVLNDSFGTSFEVVEESLPPVTELVADPVPSGNSSLLKKLTARNEELEYTVANLREQLSEALEFSGADFQDENLTLKSRVATLERDLAELEGISADAEELATVRASLEEKTSLYLEQSLVLKNKDAEIAQLRQKVSSKSEEITRLESRTKELSEQSGHEFEQRVNDLEAEARVLRERVKEVEADSHFKQDALKTANETIINLNRRLQATGGTDANTDLEDIRGNRFLKLSNKSLPNSPVSLDLGISDHPNLTFVFSGSDGSMKQVYRYIQKVSSGSSNVLIVDLATETYVDYVLGLASLVSGIDWLMSGGGVSEHLSQYPDKPSVLSMGLAYFNDSTLIDVDWESRLSELDSSGYRVFIVGGAISSLVGRFLANTVASKCVTHVVTVNQLVALRSTIFNMNGLVQRPSLVYVHRVGEWSDSNRAYVDYMMKNLKHNVKIGGSHA